MKSYWTITCPECGGSIEVDSRNGKVLRHWAKGAAAPDAPELLGMAQIAAQKAKADADVSALISKVEERQKKAEQNMEEAKRRAKEALDRGEKPISPFDLD